MATFNEEIKKREQGATAEDAYRTTAQKANPTLTGSGVSAAVPAGSKVHNNAPAMIGNYSFDTDFMAEKQKAEAAGDYGKAKQMEHLRNQKLGYMDSSYTPTFDYNYADPYAGQKERMRETIINREPFEYDYRDDAQYQAIKSLKQREAQKAYDDGYAALSTQFEGDVPVNMIHKLQNTKADIEDQADSYIPQLRQLAYQMYMNEGDALRQNYAMMQDAADEDYNRWLSNRDMRISGLENSYGRAWNEKTYKDDIEYRDRRDAVTDARYDSEWDYQRYRDSVGDDRYAQEWEYNMQQNELDREENKRRWEAEHLLNRFRTYN